MKAHSARNTTLECLYTAVIQATSRKKTKLGDTLWYLCPEDLSRAYLENVVLPEVLGTKVSGVPRVQSMVLHYDTGKKEWYVSTEGSDHV